MADTLISMGEAKITPVDILFQKLQTSKQGLSSGEAERRLSVYGKNELSEKKINPFLKFFTYFWGPIPWMIEAAAILSFLDRQYHDFWIIFTMLLLNSGVSFWQEHKAGNSIESLKKKLAVKAKIFRGGQWRQSEAGELVPGDIIRIRLGDIIPADIKIISGNYLLVDESALTGESLPVEKHQNDIAFSGSIAKQGEIDGLVVATGMSTFFGKTIRLVESVDTKSNFQKAIIKIGNYLIVLALVLVSIIFLIALFREEGIKETLQFALILAVAGIPVALPAVLSVTLAVGATMLAKKGTIVSKMAAIEEMAGIDILCSDKTGTITENKLTVKKIFSMKGFTEKDVLLYSTLASRGEDQDPLDNAVLLEAKNNSKIVSELKKYEVTDFKPFDPVPKRTEASLTFGKKKLIVSKGAPQSILSLADGKSKLDDKVDAVVADFASKGYRSVGVAKTNARGKWEYIGIIALYDQPRQDSASTIQALRQMGIKVKMITGDHIAVAREIAHQIEMGGSIILASSFENRPDTDAESILEASDGVAEVFPNHKFRIVQLFQGAGHIVGMTGDGVNDAPALKKAEVGIAVEDSTDAAKSSADIVLTKSGLSVIVDAIKESRKIFKRMNSYAIYRIAETIRILFFIALSIIIFNFYPVNAVMIVILALLNDLAIHPIVYDNVNYSKNPEKWDMNLILSIATVLGIMGVISSFLLFYMAENLWGLTQDVIRSVIFLKLAVSAPLTIYLARTRGPFWDILPSKSLVISTSVSSILAILIVYFGWFFTPVAWSLMLFILAYTFGTFLITDYIKRMSYRAFFNIYGAENPSHITLHKERAMKHT